MDLLNKIFGPKKRPSGKDINSYLSGKLNDEGCREIEESISHDPFVGDAIEGFKSMESNMDDVPSLDAFYASRSGNQPQAVTRSIRPKINSMAAMLLGAMVMGGIYLYWGDTSRSSYNDVYASNFGEFYETDSYAVRGGNDTTETLHPTKEKALLLFGKKQYEASIPFWEQYLSDVDNNDVQSHLHIGYSLMKLNREEEAIQHLSPLTEMDSKYKDEIHWYLSLAYIKLEDKSSAEQHLDILVESGHEYYQKKARQILETL